MNQIHVYFRHMATLEGCCCLRGTVLMLGRWTCSFDTRGFWAKCLQGETDRRVKREKKDPAAAATPTTTTESVELRRTGCLFLFPANQSILHRCKANHDTFSMLRSDELRIDKGVISEQASSASLCDHLLEHGIRHAAVQLQRCVKMASAAHHLYLTCERARGSLHAHTLSRLLVISDPSKSCAALQPNRRWCADRCRHRFLLSNCRISVLA